MKITFEISNPKHAALVHRFCKEMITKLKEDILEEMNEQSVQIRADLLTSARWVRWRTLPKQIDGYKLCESIVNCFQFKQRKNKYVIELNRNKLMNNSRTTLESVARFLDKGNEVVKGTYFITKVTTRYQENIYSYWRAYCLHAQMM